MFVCPSRDAASHLRPRRHRTIHGEGRKGSKQGAVEERPPAAIENALGPSCTGDEIPEADVFRVWNAAVLSRAADYLRLHPERTTLRFRMPERLAPRAAHQVDRLILFPGFVTLSGRDPGQAPDIDFRSRAPFIMGGGRQANEGSRNSVRGNAVFGIELAKQLDSPIEQAIGIVGAELKPVEAVGIPGEGSWRFYVVPGLVTVTMPCLRRFLQRSVTEL